MVVSSEKATVGKGGMEQSTTPWKREALLSTDPTKYRTPLVLKQSSYLVDPASSHMLVSKIKPCMSKYKPLHGETANGSLNQKLFI